MAANYNLITAAIQPRFRTRSSSSDDPYSPVGLLFQLPIALSLRPPSVIWIRKSRTWRVSDLVSASVSSATAVSLKTSCEHSDIRIPFGAQPAPFGTFELHYSLWCHTRGVSMLNYSEEASGRVGAGSSRLTTFTCTVAFIV